MVTEVIEYTAIFGVFDICVYVVINHRDVFKHVTMTLNMAVELNRFAVAKSRAVF